MSVLSISRIIRPNTKISQATFEYMIVLGIVLSLLLPAMFLFYNRSQSTSDEISVQRLAQMGSDLLSGAQYIYPFGSGSKTTLIATMPIGVSNITVRGTATTNTPGNELVINLVIRNSNHSLVYFSKYPIFIGNCTNVMALPADFVNNPGKKEFQIISCGANVSIYKKQ